MGFVGQSIASNVRKPSKIAIKAAVLRVLRANKDLAAAVARLAETKGGGPNGRRAAIKEVIERNPAFKAALALELLRHK
jgi:hypothetical protein